jgi:FMN phosphatase YigB (HAD superfamily)
MMIKCFIFDLGGVVIDFSNEKDYYPYLSRASGMPLNRVIGIVDRYVKVDLDKGTVSQRVFDKQVARQLGIKENEVKWYEMYKNKAGLFKGTIEIIKRLHVNYTIAYLSNIDRSRYKHTVKKILKPYLGLFGYRFASCEIALRKPSAEIYRYALRHMHYRPSEAIFIDNMMENVVGARRAGIKSILFKSPAQLESALRKMGVEL